MTNKHLVSEAVAAMSSATAELVFALADFEPQYLRVYQSHIGNALRRLKEAETALMRASVHVADELQKKPSE